MWQEYKETIDFIFKISVKNEERRDKFKVMFVEKSIIANLVKVFGKIKIVSWLKKNKNIGREGNLFKLCNELFSNEDDLKKYRIRLMEDVWQLADIVAGHLNEKGRRLFEAQMECFREKISKQIPLDT
jgi:hypothetical protein